MDYKSSELERSETYSVLDQNADDGEDIPDGDLDLSPLPSHQSYQQDLEPIILKVPGQRFALNPHVLAGLSGDLMTHYVTAWPTVIHYPSDVQKDKYPEKHPGLIKELDLVRQLKNLQKVCRLSFELINKLALAKLSNEVSQ